ncbi:MAG: DUF1614 domain-containing protein [Candidatus Bathyarchaeia archaeon]
MRRRLVFRPISALYYAILFFFLLTLLPYFALFFRGILIRGLGLPPEAVGSFLLLSLVGSFFNVPLTEVRSVAPIYTVREVSFFGVTWRLPRVEMGVKRTLVTMNVGGALVPLLVSLYLLGWSIPRCSPDPLLTYLKVSVVLAVVTLVVYRSSRLIKGLGVATPAFIPPVTVALVTLIVHWLSPLSCPTQIAYVGGTLGTLIGADLLNLQRISSLGVPMVSIGGAGTFDGVYTTGLVSVVLVFLLL